MKRSLAVLSLIVAVTALLAAACEDSPVTPTPLTGGPWRLVQIQTDDMTILEPTRPATFTLEFHADGQAAIRADCNVCSGGYQQRGDALSFERMACTQVFCGPSLENEYLAQLQAARTAESDGLDRLRIWSARGRLDFER